MDTLLQDPVVGGILREWEEVNKGFDADLSPPQLDNSLLLFLADYLEERGKPSWGRALRWMVKGDRYPLGSAPGADHWWWTVDENHSTQYCNSLPSWATVHSHPSHHFYSNQPHPGMMVEEGKGLLDTLFKLLLLWERAELADGKEYTE